jgi:hypothetical protein
MGFFWLKYNFDCCYYKKESIRIEFAEIRLRTLPITMLCSPLF